MTLALDNDGVHFTTKDPAAIVDRGLPMLHLNGLPRSIDHVAMVVDSAADVDREVERLVRHGAVLVEEPYAFPSDVCEVDVPVMFRKYLATVGLSSGMLVVSAPLSVGDQLDRHLRDWGPDVPHHVAVLVSNVSTAVRNWIATGYRAGRITDDGDLAQVFLASPAGQVVELISRRCDNSTTFSCSNVAALSVAEDELRNPEVLR